MADAAMSGAERAAVLLLGLGEEAAAAVLKHLNPMEVQNVGEALSSVSTVSSDKRATVVGEFTETVQQGGKDLIGSEEYVRKVLYSALGEDKAKSMLGRILQANNPSGLEALKWMESDRVASLIRDEHPQICAVVLMSLEGEHAAEVLQLLPPEKRPEIMIRVANLDTINPNALDELNDMMQKQLAEKSYSSSSRIDGIRTAAGILNFVNSDAEEMMMTAIEETDEDLCEKIREKMIIFDNLMSLNDKDMQRMLREIETESLVLALKGAEENLRNRFFSNMSRRAAEMLQEDIEIRGPVRLSEVEHAQKEILNLAARLADEGEVSFGKAGGEEEYV